MRLIALTVLSATTLSVLASCKSPPPPPPPPRPPPAAAATEPSGGGEPDTRMATANYEAPDAGVALPTPIQAVGLQVAEYGKRMTGELNALEAELALMASRVESSNAAAKAEAKAAVEVIKVKWQNAKRQVDLAGSATEQTWERLRADAEASFIDLKGSIEDSRKKVSDLIAP
jgi:hypothetical protein